MKKREFQLRNKDGKVLRTIYAEDSERALDIIFDEMLFDVEAENEPMSLQDYRDNEADSWIKSQKESA